MPGGEQGTSRAIGRALLLVALVATGAGAVNADAQEPQAPKEPAAVPPGGGDEALRRELEELRTRQRWLERRLTAAEKAAADTKAANEARAAEEMRRASDEARLAAQVQAAAHPPNADSEEGPVRLHFGRHGFSFGTADGKNTLHIGLVLHVDGRAYFTDRLPISDTFLIRRARPDIAGTLFGIVDYRLLTDFGQGTPQILDAYIELHPVPWLKLRAGRWRVPIGLEWLQSDSTIVLVERSLASDLIPLRDLGVMLNGAVGGGTFEYQIGVFNGAPDSGNGPDFDPQSSKDYVGRVFFHPLRPSHREVLSNLGLGVAGSYGTSAGAAASALPSYKSIGQQVIFSYIAPGPAMPGALAAAGVLPGSNRWRVSPQLYWYLGPVGILAEYMLSSQSVQRNGETADLQNRAWNLTTSFVLTLEHASYEGVVPRHPVDFRHPHFGAIEVAFRYSELRIDPQAFPDFADPSLSVKQARELSGGFNWYLTEHVRFMLSFSHTDFLQGAPLGGNREPENALLGRLQIKL